MDRDKGTPTAVRKAPAGELLLAVLVLGVPLVLYGFVLVERKHSVLLGKGAFLRQYTLSLGEKIAFPIVFAVQILALLLTATLLVRAAFGVLRRGARPTRFAALLVAFAYLAAVTAQFEVYRYFKDGIDLAVAKDLGGGDWGTVLDYVREELVGLLPVVVAGLAGAVAGIWALKRFGGRTASWLQGRRWVRGVTSTRGVVLMNAVLMLLPLPAFHFLPALENGLGYSLAHRAYKLPGVYLTDVDGDGFGLMDRPLDREPFDGSRYPYARDLPGNGIDENGIGGDLPAASWPDVAGPWAADALERRNVILIVMESARPDLIGARVDGRAAMPNLETLGGQQVGLMAHSGYTVPGICAMFNGTLSKKERGLSLIDRLQDMGYATGIFSGQSEEFGDIAALTNMKRADVFRDAATFPIDERMYTSTNQAALAMPARIVGAALLEWIQSLDRGRPYFAYWNIQELHFPYSHRGTPLELIEKPIPRSQIDASNREWILKTYLNGAHVADTAMGRVFDALRKRGDLSRTVIVIAGDHGEELYENGYLGHGVNLSYEQYEPLGIVHGSAWKAPPGPIGLSEVSTLIHNALARDPARTLPLKGSVLSFSGPPHRPAQIGRWTADGMVKYDFFKDAWSRQDRRGAPFRPADPVPGIVHAWESYVQLRLPE